MATKSSYRRTAASRTFRSMGTLESGGPARMEARLTSLICRTTSSPAPLILAKGSGSVSVLDLAKRSLVTTIPVAKKVQRISMSPDGLRVFTHDQDAPRIAVIDTATNKITKWIELPSPAYASEATPDGRWLLALSMVANRLFVVDLQTLKVVRSLEVPTRSSEILIRPGGEIAYISGTGAGKIAVLDLRAWEMQQSIELTPGVDGLAWIPATHER